MQRRMQDSPQHKAPTQKEAPTYYMAIFFAEKRATMMQIKYEGNIVVTRVQNRYVKMTK